MRDLAKTSILFVDDEPDLLNGLRRSLHVHRRDYDMRFARGPREALSQLDERKADLVISDMRMPDMNGVELLSEVHKRWPGTLRFILSGHADASSLPQAVPVTHAWLSKPCTREDLINLMERGRKLQSHLANPDLQEQLRRLPEIQLQVPKALLQEDAVAALQVLISDREELHLRVLELASSASFSLPRILVDFESAVETLGLRSVGQLAMAAEILLALETERGQFFDAPHMRAECVEVTKLHSRILDYAGVSSEGAMAAGLLHRIGLSIQELSCPQMLSDSLPDTKGDGKRLAQAQRERFGFDYADLGAAFLLDQSLPVQVVEAVAFHERPTEAQPESFELLSALHVAARLLPEPVTGVRPIGPDPALLELLGLEHMQPTWDSMARQTAVASNLPANGLGKEVQA